jgi:hypothetical protein
VNEKGDTLLELYLNKIAANPAGCTKQSHPRGFRILDSSSEPLLEVLTQDFPMGHLTRIKARLFDEHGDLRIGLLGESIQVHGEAKLILEAPFTFNGFFSVSTPSVQRWWNGRSTGSRSCPRP